MSMRVCMLVFTGLGVACSGKPDDVPPSAVASVSPAEADAKPMADGAKPSASPAEQQRADTPTSATPTAPVPTDSPAANANPDDQGNVDAEKKTTDPAAARAVNTEPPKPGEGEADHAVRAKLEDFLAGTLAPGEVHIVYDDLHGLHGGMKLEIRGDGSVEQTVRSPGGSGVEPAASKVKPDQVRRLVELLVAEQAWRQTTADRPRAADESVATLSIAADSARSSVWEFYNEMKPTQGVGKIKAFMLQISRAP